MEDELCAMAPYAGDPDAVQFLTLREEEEELTFWGRLGELMEEFDSHPPKRPWSATGCEVCDGSGTLEHAEQTVTVCWYCKGSGWYEAAT